MQDKEEINELRKKLALACRVLFMEGLADYNLGHASGRIPGQESVYIKPQGLGLEEVAPDDMIVIDMEANKVEGKHPPHGENPIHTEIYKVRKDVNSVVHVHPVLTTAFSSVRSEIKPLNQDGVIFPQGVPFFESPELVTTQEQGRELAQKLGAHNAVVLQNHGIVTVGPRIEEVCMNSIFFEHALRVQLNASEFGKIEPISEEVALKMHAQCKNPRRYDMIWSYLVRKLKREKLSLEHLN